MIGVKEAVLPNTFHPTYHEPFHVLFYIQADNIKPTSPAHRGCVVLISSYRHQQRQKVSQSVILDLTAQSHISMYITLPCTVWQHSGLDRLITCIDLTWAHYAEHIKDGNRSAPLSDTEIPGRWPVQKWFYRGQNLCQVSSHSREGQVGKVKRRHI